MKKKYALIVLFTTLISSQLLAKNNELWSHINSKNSLINHNVITSFSLNQKNRVLHIYQPKKNQYAWVSIPAPTKGWKLDNSNYIIALITNTGDIPVEMMLWVVPDYGWDAVGEKRTIKAGESLQLKCNLRATYNDGTPKLRPQRIRKIEIMLLKASAGASIQVEKLIASGTAPDWIMPEKRMEVPNMKNETYAAGKRVCYQLTSDTGTNIYSALYLPKTWNPKGKYPVIVEFPGNIYYTGNVYSTGLPEQCAIGYGMSKNEEAIWVSVPFVDYDLKENIKNGFGNLDNTADYTIKIVKDIIDNFGGDSKNIILTGFSRGAIACGYIGRRNNKIASLWKGFHACQHYDGDGWKGATLHGAKERAKRIGKRSIFHTDNEQHEDLKTMLSEVKANVTYATSGLGAHATAMFLDDRPSTVKLRSWYKKLIKNK